MASGSGLREGEDLSDVFPELVALVLAALYYCYGCGNVSANFEDRGKRGHRQCQWLKRFLQLRQL